MEGWTCVMGAWTRIKGLGLVCQGSGLVQQLFELAATGNSSGWRQAFQSEAAGYSLLEGAVSHINI